MKHIQAGDMIKIIRPHDERMSDGWVWFGLLGVALGYRPDGDMRVFHPEVPEGWMTHVCFWPRKFISKIC